MSSNMIKVPIALLILLTLIPSVPQCAGTYSGRVKIHIVEPNSRWLMKNSQPYHFALLDYAYDSSIVLNEGDSLKRTITWNGPAAGYSGITENNIMAIAAVYNSEWHQGYSRPNNQGLDPYPFDAHYVDACAASDAGNSWPNESNEDFTHTVFVEEGTACWCEFCPKSADALDYIYENNGYPFFFVAMVVDRCGDAYSRMYYDLNIYGMPECYFDGGYEVFVRGTDTLSFYETRIESCGAREVPPLDLSVDLTWQGGGTITIDLFLKNPGGSTPVDDNNVAGLPADYQLAQNYPNPFNPSTFIAYTLSRKSDVNISVYDILGRKVTTLVDKPQPAGNYQIEWNGLDINGNKVAAGVYFYLMRTNDFSETRKMILLK